MTISLALTVTIVAHVLLAIALALHVIVLRNTERVGIGDGNNRKLRRSIRVHSNFTEWVPLALLALLAAELRGTPEPWIAGLGAALFVSRLGHAWGLNRSIGASIGRTGGITLMLVVMLISCGLALKGG